MELRVDSKPITVKLIRSLHIGKKRDMDLQMQRVMIVGCAGSGKSTLARFLSGKTGLPVIHIDKIYWSEGWVMRPMEDIRPLIEKAVQSSKWIFDGNNSSSFDLRSTRADTIIFLDLPTHVCLFRVLKRTLKHYGETRDDMAAGCRERFDWPFLKWIYGYRKTGRPKVLKLLHEAPASVRTYHLRNSDSVDAFMRSV